MTTIKHNMSRCEQCWILLGKRHDEGSSDLWWGKPYNHSEGQPAVVSFDPKFVIERDEQYKDVVGFIHTHPGMNAHFSSRDYRTMQAWVTCLGRPLVCCIAGLDGLRAWWFMDDENEPIEDCVEQVDGIIFGLVPYLETADTQEGELNGSVEVSP